MMVDVAILSRQRTHIYGIATIMILMVHSISYSDWDSPLLHIVYNVCKYGSLGVPIFAFLSGMSIYYSLSKNDVVSFYKNRLRRTFVPFFIMAFVFSFAIYILYDFQPNTFVKEITTISFWMDHHGPWYIAMLVPLYLLSPLFYKLLNSRIGGGDIGVFNITVPIDRYYMQFSRCLFV